MIARRSALFFLFASLGAVACTPDGAPDAAPVATPRGDLPIGAIGAVGADIPSATTSAIVEPPPAPQRKARRPHAPPDPFSAPELAPSDASAPAPKSEGTAL